MARGWCRAALLCWASTTAAWGAGCAETAACGMPAPLMAATDRFEIDHHGNGVDVVRAQSNTARYRLMFGPSGTMETGGADRRSALGLAVNGFNWVRQGYVYYASDSIDDPDAQGQDQKVRGEHVLYHPRVMARLTRSSSPRTRIVVRVVRSVDAPDQVMEQVFHLCEENDTGDIKVELFNDASNMANNNLPIATSFVNVGCYSEVKRVSDGAGGYRYTFSKDNQPIPWADADISAFITQVRTAAANTGTPWTACTGEPAPETDSGQGGSRGGR